MLLVLSSREGEFQREVERGKGRSERRVGDKIVLLGDMRPTSMKSHILAHETMMRGLGKEILTKTADMRGIEIASI
jgi:hypothetical protein